MQFYHRTSVISIAKSHVIRYTLSIKLEVGGVTQFAHLCHACITLLPDHMCANTIK